MTRELNSLNDIKNEIQRLQRRANTIEKKEKTKIIDDIVRTMWASNLTPEDVEKAFNHRPVHNESTNIIKYQHPDGRTWSGRGRPPAWIKQVESEGGSREDYVIDENPLN